MQRPFLYVKNISWYTVVLVWQCVGMQNDNFFCFSYNNYIQKIQKDRKMRLVDAVFMRIKELMKERGVDNVPIGYLPFCSTEITAIKKILPAKRSMTAEDCLKLSTVSNKREKPSL